MSDTRQDQLEGASILRQMLDGLASQLILSDGSSTDQWIEDVATALARISAMAELSGRMDIRGASLISSTARPECGMARKIAARSSPRSVPA